MQLNSRALIDDPCNGDMKTHPRDFNKIPIRAERVRISVQLVSMGLIANPSN